MAGDGEGNQLPWPCRSKEKGRGQCRLRPVPSTWVLGTILTMVRTEGPRSLYSGLAAGLQRRDELRPSVRIGLYDQAVLHQGL